MATREDFPSNSKISKPSSDKKQIQKVVKGDVKIRKKSVTERFAEDFLASDVRTVSGSVLFDILIPAIKDAISSAGKGIIDGLLFGSGTNSSRIYRDKDQSRVYRSYERYADTPAKSRSSANSTSRGSRYSDPVFTTRDDADEVLVGMLDILDEYEVVTVKDLYGFLGQHADYTAGEYGWYNLDDAKVLRVREGFMLKLPRPKVID